MAEASVSSPGNRVTPSIHRSVTLPTNFLTARRDVGRSIRNPGQDGREILFSHGACRIVRFKPPKQNPSSGSGLESRGPETHYKIPWASRTESTVASGPIEVYRIPGSATFLSSGQLVHTIMSKSVCWCVDGESRFVFPRRDGEFYRIELLGDAEPMARAAEEFKLVLPQILQYETTACPFERPFDVELPEQREITYLPWKPKHTPISSQGILSEDAEITDHVPRLARMETLQVRKQRESSSPIDDKSNDTAALEVAINNQDNLHPVTFHEDENANQRVEATISSYENMKSPDMLTPLSEREILDQYPRAQVWMHTAMNYPSALSDPFSMRVRESPKLDLPSGSLITPLITGLDEANISHTQRFSANDVFASTSIADGPRANRLTSTLTKHAFHAENRHTGSLVGQLGRSFTAPPGFITNETSPEMFSASVENQEDLQKLPESKQTMSSLVERDELSSKATTTNYVIDERSQDLSLDFSNGQTNLFAETEQPVTPIRSEMHASTPEWLALSPAKPSFSDPTSAAVTEETEKFPTKTFQIESNRAGETLTSCADVLHVSEEISTGDMADQTGVVLLSDDIIQDIGSTTPQLEHSASGQLRQRFHARRARSFEVLGPELSLREPSESPAEQVSEKMVERLLRQVYGLILIPVVPIVGFVLTFLFQLKHGFPETVGVVDLKRESHVPCAWESYSSASEPSSPTKIDDDSESFEDGLS